LRHGTENVPFPFDTIIHCANKLVDLNDRHCSASITWMFLGYACGFKCFFCWLSENRLQQLSGSYPCS